MSFENFLTMMLEVVSSSKAVCDASSGSDSVHNFVRDSLCLASYLRAESHSNVSPKSVPLSYQVQI